MAFRTQHRLALFAAALWWGSLGAVGFFVVPMLFANLGTPAQAGTLAARLFAGQTWISVACSLVLLMAARPRDPDGGPAGPAHSALLFVILGLLLALLSQYGVSPRIVARENLRLWHMVGSAMYLAQWLCAAIVLWRLQAAQPQPVL